MPVRKGDLATTSVATVLTELAESAATGCLRITDPEGDEATVYLRDGAVYAATVPGRRPQLGARLMTSGALPPSALSEALDAQRTELQGWRLGELLVHLGYVEAAVVEAFVTEQLRECCWDLSHWRTGRWRFRAGDRTRDDVAAPVPVSHLLAEVDRREREWAAMAGTVHGVLAVPRLAADGAATDQLVVDGDAWSLLSSVDGDRTIAELARDCGFTLFEAAQVVHRLVRQGLLEVDGETADMDAADEPELVDLDELLETIDSQVVEGDATTVAAAMIAALETAPARRRPIEPNIADLVSRVQVDEDPTRSLSRVSAALADLLGPALESADPFEMTPRRPDAPVQGEPPVPPSERAETDRRLRVRNQAAATLAAIQAEAEAQKGETQRVEADEAEAQDADVVDLAAVRQRDQDRREAERVEAERIEAERIEAERIEAERVEAERIEAERIEAEGIEAERAETERLAVEEAAQLEVERLEVERLEAERVEAERVEAEQVEAERLVIQRLAVEEAAQLEAERLEAERAEAERIDAERLAADAAAEAVETEPYPSLDQGQTGWSTTDDYADPFALPYGDDRADTAALLRELSSLGDPDPAPDRAAPATATPRPTGAAPAQIKKRKGRFGF